MHGVPVTAERSWSAMRRTSSRLSVPVGSWESGLYFIRLRQRTAAWGSHHSSWPRAGSACIASPSSFPTLTWQAYNFRDDDGDGSADSWYADGRRRPRPPRPSSPDRGVPYSFRYHLGFHKWLHWSRKQADYLSQWDLEQVASSDVLAREYDLIVFAGHHEYVTAKEYDLVEGFRDRGGNLMFLSANNFFGRVERKGQPRPSRVAGAITPALKPRSWACSTPHTKREPRAPWIASIRRARGRSAGPACARLAVRPRRRRDRSGDVRFAEPDSDPGRDPRPVRAR